MANPIPEKNTCGRCMNRPYGNSNNLRIELGPLAADFERWATALEQLARPAQIARGLRRAS